MMCIGINRPWHIGNFITLTPCGEWLGREDRHPTVEQEVMTMSRDMPGPTGR